MRRHRLHLWVVLTRLLGAVLYSYGLAMCFNFNPAGLQVFPGIVAGAGAALLIVAMAELAMRQKGRW